MDKGQQIALVGRIQTRTWDDNDGKKHYVTEVVTDKVFFADSKKSGSGQQSFNQESEAASGGDGFFPMDEDDELPF